MHVAPGSLPCDGRTGEQVPEKADGIGGEDGPRVWSLTQGDGGHEGGFGGKIEPVGKCAQTKPVGGTAAEP